ncbi:MAG: tetratricopeptide repeat protein [Alkalinema sp. RU_4_3]|nr:tetratricopeptide repeat protein [Alkalinema sp. RU_4_3]
MSSESLPLLYVAVLFGLLVVAAVVIFQQVFKTRRLDSSLNRLQSKLNKEKGTGLEYYELGSVQLDKRLYSQAIVNLQKAIKAKDIEGPTLAPVYNALGYAYFAQEKFDQAMKNYKEALKLLPDYVTALNNLGHTYERKQIANKALECYDEALRLEPGNATAKRRSEALKNV